MARARGPEEFFEVFRTMKKPAENEDKQPAKLTKPADATSPPPSPEHEHVPLEPNKPSPAIYYHAGIGKQNTDGLGRSVLKASIVLRRDSIIYAAISVVLLLILSYVIGFDTGRRSRNHTATGQGISIAEAQPTPRIPPASIVGIARTELPSAPARFELLISTIGPANSRNRERGEQIASELNTLSVFREYGLEAYTVVSGQQQVLRVRGNFISDSDEFAQTVLRTIRSLEYQGRKDFTTARFVPIQ